MMDGLPPPNKKATETTPVGELFEPKESGQLIKLVQSEKPQV